MRWSRQRSAISGQRHLLEYFCVDLMAALERDQPVGDCVRAEPGLRGSDDFGREILIAAAIDQRESYRARQLDVRWHFPAPGDQAVESGFPHRRPATCGGGAL